MDAVAELIILQGKKPVSTIKEYLKLATVKELGGRNYKDSEVIEIVKEYLAHLKAAARKIHEELYVAVYGQISSLFLKSAAIEKQHEESYRALLKNVEKNNVFKKAGITM